MRLLVILALAVPLSGLVRQGRTFTGTISDSMCGMDHSGMRMGPTDAECTDACIAEHDAVYVLVDGKTVYQLSNQQAPKPFAGRKVKVVGTLDSDTSTISVTSITGA